MRRFYSYVQHFRRVAPLTGWLLLVAAAGQGQDRKGIRFNGGYVGYSYYYRGNLDTPYTEKNIGQHQVLSTLNFIVAGLIPIRVNSFVRRSNSALFRDITDVQVSFDAAAYRSGLLARMRDSLAAHAPSPDSILEKLYKLRRMQALGLAGWLRDPLNGQKLIEANEILKVPRLTYSAKDGDSTNQHREDSLRSMAREFMELYAATKGRYDSLSGQVDSLRERYERAVQDSRKYAQLIKGGFGNYSSYEQWKKELEQYAAGAGGRSGIAGRPGTGEKPGMGNTPGMGEKPGDRRAVPELPGGYEWLLGLRSFGLGKNNVNVSELTAKNVSLNGVHFVYNSWYYLGVSAGLVDYRFRDFVIRPVHNSKQYLYVLRAGLGRLEHNYFIVSVFGGRKQLLTTSVNGSIAFTGVAAETRWQLLRNVYLTAEAAQSFSPAWRGDSTRYKTGWNWGDRSNKALSLKLYSWWPATNTRVEGQYKFLGANYQSFNAFQTSTELRAWYVKAEQLLFGRQLKLMASLRTNDYSNPYITQNYKANTIFKSISLTFSRKGLPVVSLGYLPMSQLTKVGSQVEESRFQTLNASVNHFYKIGLRPASTTLVYTRFFNSGADSAFIYYNADNIYLGQTLFFRDFTATMAFAHSSSPGYALNVLESSVSFQCLTNLSLGMGAKLNELNHTDARPGGFFSGSLLIGKGDQLSVRVEKGYLPSSGKESKLAPDLSGNVSFMKALK